MGAEKQIKIILSGGGTAGSVSPLLAVYEEFRRDRQSPDFRTGFLFIGSADGPEKEMAGKEEMPFRTIPSGKLRRYFSWRNFVDPFLISAGFFKSLCIIHAYRPDLVITAGSFVSVPVVWAAWLLRVPVLVHQQDVRPGLANKLMAPFAAKITVTFPGSLKDYGPKAVWTGNPARTSLGLDGPRPEPGDFPGAAAELPTILILGGSTGASAINGLLEESLGDLVRFCRVIHQTGRGKGEAKASGNYTAYEFLPAGRLSSAYAAADVIVSRCGMGTLTELARLRKPSILIPMPDSHQEDNARIFRDNNAAIVLDQKGLTPEIFIGEIKRLLEDGDLRMTLARNMGTIMKEDANAEMMKLIKTLINR